MRYSNPYLAGSGLGLVLLAAFVLAGHGLGASGAFGAAAAGTVSAVAPGYASANPYLGRFLANPGGPWHEWLLFEVAGMFIGGFFSAGLARRLRGAVERGAGVTAASRLATAGGGGAVMGVGAVLARGCTSGLALSGGALLSVGSWVFMLTAFAAAYAVARDEAIVALIDALAVGMAFGFALERAGLGSARKLTGQFFLTDLTVFKVMFSAIVTAMLGVFWLGRAGLIDPSLLYVPETFLSAQIAGGLIFGAGFALAGLCPGTSCVSAATGRGDGAMVVAGMFGGVLATGLAFPLVERLYNSGARGPLTLPQLLHLPDGLVIFLVVLTALAGFTAAEAIEARAVSLPRVPRPAPMVWVGIAVLALGVAAAVVRGPGPRKATHTTAAPETPRVRPANGC